MIIGQSSPTTTEYHNKENKYDIWGTNLPRCLMTREIMIRYVSWKWNGKFGEVPGRTTTLTLLTKNVMGP